MFLSSTSAKRFATCDYGLAGYRTQTDNQKLPMISTTGEKNNIGVADSRATTSSQPENDDDSTLLLIPSHHYMCVVCWVFVLHIYYLPRVHSKADYISIFLLFFFSSSSLRSCCISSFGWLHQFTSQFSRLLNVHTLSSHITILSRLSIVAVFMLVRDV